MCVCVCVCVRTPIALVTVGVCYQTPLVSQGSDPVMRRREERGKWGGGGEEKERSLMDKQDVTEGR